MLEDYLHELATFPNGQYDDQADSTSQALDWIKGHSAESYAWFRLQARAALIQLGDVEEVKKMDAKYGPPKEDSKVAAPSGPAVHNGSDGSQKPGGPCIYVGPEHPDPDLVRFKRRSIFSEN